MLRFFIEPGTMVPEGPYSGPVHIPGMTICWGRGVEVVGEGGWEEGVVVLCWMVIMIYWGSRL